MTQRNDTGGPSRRPQIAKIINTRTGLDIGNPTGRNSVTVMPCPRCQATTLVALDGDIAGIPVRVDPTPLTRRDEAQALLAGRATFRLFPGRRPNLERRDHWQIAGSPADTVVVLPDHACGQRLAPYATIRQRPVEETPDERPPF